MIQQDPFRTIQIQRNQINQLKSQLQITSTYQNKYKKALKEISQIIKANRQLKEELKRFSILKVSQNDSQSKIQQQELGKAYEKILKEKNQLLGEKESLELQNQKLRYSIASLQDSVSKLKSQKMTLVQEKQGLSKMNSGSNQKQRQRQFSGYKQRENDLKKVVENYEDRINNLTKNNRKLEDQISELQNKLYTSEIQYKQKLNEKDYQLKVGKISTRDQYQGQINSLKKQISQLKISNNQLNNRINSYSSMERKPANLQNQYQGQLIQTLRDLKMQMGPMSAQIAELQQKNESQKQQVLREKAALQIKVIEYEAEIQRIKQSHKLLQQKIVKQTQKSRKWDDTEKTIRKLQEQNRMLGGRVIVLQAKEVALRNRSGDQLQERVLQFQSRVEMLLNDKQTISNMKNIGIHQLIALKAYIMQLDGKLKQVVNQNEYAVKKYKSYKEKCTQLIRQLKQHDIAINALKGKLQGYDRLVVKLQGQLERAFTINDNQMKAINVKISQSTINSIQVYKKRYQSLLQKLNLQQKYAQQEIQTLKLNYDTKLLDLNLKLQQLNSIKETIGLYKNKNQELSNRLTQKQNELLESKMTKVVITDTMPQQKNPHKDTINKLHETINTKQTTIVNLESQIKRLELEWKNKYNQLQQTMNNAEVKKNRQNQEKRRQVQQLQNQIKKYILRINEFQSKSIPKRIDEDHDYRRPHQITGQISDLQVQLEQMKNRYEIESTKVIKLTKTNAELKQTNNDLQVQLSRTKFQLKRVSKEMEIELEDKNSQLKRVQTLAQQNLDSSRFKKPQSQSNNFKLATMKMEFEMLQSQAQQSERDKTKYYNRAIDLERYVSQLNMKIQELSYAVQRAKNISNNDMIAREAQKQQQIEKLQLTLKNFRDKNADLQDRINQYQSEIQKIRGDFNREKQRLQSQIDMKDEQLSKVSRELNKIRYEITSRDEIKAGIEQQYEYKFNRLNNQLANIKQEFNNAQQNVQRYEGQLRFLKNRQLQFNSKSSEQENYLLKLNSQLKNFQDRELEMQSQMMQKQTLISKLTSELNYIRAQISNIQMTIQSKDNQISKLGAELNLVKNNQFQWEMQISNKASDFNKLSSELAYAKNQIQNLEEELNFTKSQLSRQRSQSLSNEQNYSSQIQELQQKQMIILRLQSENKSKNEQIQDINFQLQSKNSKILELQNQSIRYRSMSSDIESELMEKNSMISRLNYEINNWKIRYENLENQQQSVDSNWTNLNRQLNNVRSQINTYQDDIASKNLAIQRYKGDIKDLTQQMQQLNQQIFNKNNIINNLNQQLFRLKLEGQEKSSQQIYRLQNQIYQLKSRVSNLQGELQLKQQELNRAKLQISTVRSNITVNRYSDDQYQLLQAQFYQAQRSLTETRSIISEKDLQITQLQAKIQHLKRLEVQAKRRFVQQRNDLETQLQNVLNRERQLRNQVTNLENQALLTQNRISDDKQWGLHLYQQQCGRLQKIVEQLQEQVNSLKLKLTYMTNQEDRIIENLTIMTLTFAQVEALRQRMKIKQVEINQVRKSLINFATSSEQITSMGSRLLIKDKNNMSHQKQNKSQEKYSFQQLDGNNYFNYNKFSNVDPNSNYLQTYNQKTYPQRQNDNSYQTEGFNFKKQYDRNVATRLGYTSSNNQSGRTYEYEGYSYTQGFNKKPYESVEKSDSTFKYQTQYVPSQSQNTRSGQYQYKINEQLKTQQNKYSGREIFYANANQQSKDPYLINQETDKKLNQFVKANYQSNQNENGSKKSSKIYDQQNNTQFYQKQEQSLQRAQEQHVPTYSGSIEEKSKTVNQNKINQTIVITQQSSQQKLHKQTPQINNQKSQQTLHPSQSQGTIVQNLQNMGNYSQQFVSPQLQPSLSSQQLSSQQITTQQSSWRYGGQRTANQNQIGQFLGQGSSTNIGSVNPGLQIQAQPLQTTQRTSQQQIRVMNYGSNNSIGSNKILTPPTNIVSYNVPKVQPLLPQQSQIPFQNRQFGVQQSSHYPGFAR